ncbi:Dabb family protein [Clostridium sp. SHJSY1]|uniref:Dabb family protein n=1 Tax=Clostridium sp. SHJSY1 TaxID=2942483 RepID=UPI0028760C60|nr:Dabb family protein [Clostridium sp. SHJSY1]MDS0524502.1 Dabb family protein [Clostridium sp. SHJSY1]
MIKHIVLWKLSETGKKEGAEKIIEILKVKFDALIGVVDGLKEIEVGLNYNGEEYDLVLYSVFETKEAEKNYQTHPAHLEVKKIIQRYVEGRACVDYLI